MSKRGTRVSTEPTPEDIADAIIEEAAELHNDLGAGTLANADAWSDELIAVMRHGEKGEDFYFGRYLDTEDLTAIAHVAGLMMTAAGFAKMAMDDTKRVLELTKLAAQVVSALVEPSLTVIFYDNGPDVGRDPKEIEAPESDEVKAVLFFLVPDDWKTALPSVKKVVPDFVFDDIKSTLSKVKSMTLSGTEVLAVPILVPIERSEVFRGALVESGIALDRTVPVPVFGANPVEGVDRMIESGEIAAHMSLLGADLRA